MTLFHKVPVIVLWTKTDSLDLNKIKQLMKEGNNQAEAMEQAPKKAWADFEEKIYPIFNRFKYLPKAYVVLRSEHFILTGQLYMANCVGQGCMNLEVIVMT